MDVIRERYREEQLVSDRMRGISAYGTFALTLTNVIMFVVVHGWLEPRKRRLMMAELDECVRSSQTASLSKEPNAASNAIQLMLTQHAAVLERLSSLQVSAKALRDEPSLLKTHSEAASKPEPLPSPVSETASSKPESTSQLLILPVFGGIVGGLVSFLLLR
jgi:hypothetical protein